MTFISSSSVKRTLLSLVFLLVLLSACSLGANTSPVASTPSPTPGTPPQTLQIRQASADAEPSDPWTFLYRGVEFTIGSTDQQLSFADDSDSKPEGDPWIFRLYLKAFNPVKSPLSMSTDWYLDEGENVLAQTMSFKLVTFPPGTSDLWVDFPLRNKMDPGQLTLQVGGGTEAVITTSLTRPGDLQKYHDRSITTNTTFEYGNSQWTVEKITSSISWTFSSQFGATGMQANGDSRFIIITMKGTFKDNGLKQDGEVLPIADARLGETRSYSGTFPTVLVSRSNPTTSGALIFQVQVGSDGQIGPLDLLFPSNLEIGKVSITFTL
ncbi:hypothetical protein Krac_0216 [Ktedonobacter racemifer DSM 44963]|uniref:DUF4352 domain-containing protein n=1 Tax=Ktedonobacter racemifer DSM 44963 TaxID=485913 RepID=D6U763_KTERA|nr:hypothetical protein Krac_0216 [Ktedonobacter racemifer DSM 44963]